MVFQRPVDFQRLGETASVFSFFETRRASELGVGCHGRNPELEAVYMVCELWTGRDEVDHPKSLISAKIVQICDL